MGKSAMFDRNRSYVPDEGRTHPLRLRPDQGALPGRYSSPEPNEYSDDYFGPADRYERRGFDDDFNPPRQAERGYVGGVVWRDPNIRPTAQPTDSGHYGELGHGWESWASLKRHMSENARQHRDYRGRGPKGYVRSDTRLHEVICEMLAHDPHIDATEVAVEVKNGVVTLAGNVDDRRTKFAIEQKVAECSGVKDIHNQVRTWRPR
jgi:hypothetical protein